MYDKLLYYEGVGIILDLSILLDNPQLLNEIVRVTQKTVPVNDKELRKYKHCADECIVRDGIAFACEDCHKLFCAFHAFNTAGKCPECVQKMFNKEEEPEAGVQ